MSIANKVSLIWFLCVWAYLVPGVGVDSEFLQYYYNDVMIFFKIGYFIGFILWQKGQ